MLSTFSAAEIVSARKALANGDQRALGEVAMEIEWRGHSLAEFAQITGTQVVALKEALAAVMDEGD